MNKTEATSLSVIIPVYNSQATLDELWGRLNDVLNRLEVEFEVIFVNDCSKDESWSVLQRLVKSSPRVKAVSLSRNYGQHNAILCGVRLASFSVIVTMDDDIQHPPEEIPKLLDTMRQGYDVVYGTFPSENHGFWRVKASRLTKHALQLALGVPGGRNVSPFRAFRTQLREAFVNFKGPLPNIDVMLSWGSTNFGSVEVKHNPRIAAASGYSLAKLIKHALNMITGFSILPLQLASIMGFVFTLIGLIFLLYIVGRYLIQGSPVQGFPFLASITCIFSGAQLFSLGIIGEYFGRVHLRLMEKPTYTIATSLNINNSEQS
jgi:undecaprenyl-phosphate 4-deoxy-4-formamido-L-arabinose transferase